MKLHEAYGKLSHALSLIWEPQSSPTVAVNWKFLVTEHKHVVVIKFYFLNAFHRLKSMKYIDKGKSDENNMLIYNFKKVAESRARTGD